MSDDRNPNSQGLDQTDRRIIRCLLEDAAASNNVLAERVGLTAAPLSRRLARLFGTGILRRTVSIDPLAVGLGFQAFLQVTLSRTGVPVTEAFVARVRRMPEVAECHLVAGDFDYLLKICVHDVAEYKRLIWDQFERAEEIKSLRSIILLDSPKLGPAAIPAEPTKPRRSSSS